MYLLEDSEEAQMLRQNVCNLLRSHEEGNLNLAYQIIKSGGFHEDFASLVSACAIEEVWNDREEKMFGKFLKHIFNKSELYRFKKLVAKHWSWDYFIDMVDMMTQRKTDFFLSAYTHSWALYAFEWYERCDRFCLRHGLISGADIFKALQYSTWEGNTILSLEEFELDDLPDDFANLPIDCLYLLKNPMRHFKKKEWQNTTVKEVVFDDTIPDFAKKSIAKCFPTFWKNILNKKLHKDRVCMAFLKCIPPKDRNIQFYKKCAAQYKAEKNYKMALKCYEYLEKTYPYPEESFKFKIAGCYALMKDKANMLKWLLLHKAETPFDFQKDWDFAHEFGTYKKNRSILKLLKA